MAKKTIIPARYHRECRHAELHRWPLNPLLVRCRRTGERFPVSCGMRCPFFRERTVPDVIIDHPYGFHPDWDSMSRDIINNV